MAARCCSEVDWWLNVLWRGYPNGSNTLCWASLSWNMRISHFGHGIPQRSWCKHTGTWSVVNDPPDIYWESASSKRGSVGNSVCRCRKPVHYATFQCVECMPHYTTAYDLLISHGGSLRGHYLFNFLPSACVLSQSLQVCPLRTPPARCRDRFPPRGTHPPRYLPP